VSAREREARLKARKGSHVQVGNQYVRGRETKIEERPRASWRRERAPKKVGGSGWELKIAKHY